MAKLVGVWDTWTRVEEIHFTKTFDLLPAPREEFSVVGAQVLGWGRLDEPIVVVPPAELGNVVIVDLATQEVLGCAEAGAGYVLFTKPSCAEGIRLVLPDGVHVEVIVTLKMRREKPLA